jgi:hypothetical protein
MGTGLGKINFFLGAKPGDINFLQTLWVFCAKSLPKHSHLVDPAFKFRERCLSTIS